MQTKFKLKNIVFRTAVETARFSRDDGLWHLSVKNQETGEVRTRTCNILISCLGGLTIPNDPPFKREDFTGEVFHSARWREDVSLKGKDVVVVGNGACDVLRLMRTKLTCEIRQAAPPPRSFPKLSTKPPPSPRLPAPGSPSSAASRRPTMPSSIS